VSLGVAFTNVKGEDIAPAVELIHSGDRITLSAISIILLFQVVEVVVWIIFGDLEYF
jgi:hypothetical protein